VTALRDFVRALMVIVDLFVFAFVAGGIVGAFFWGLFFVAGLAPG
jgi:hypothetical protein